MDMATIKPPQDGVYIYGLFLEGARWDSSEGALVEPLRRELYSEMPLIWLKPNTAKKVAQMHAQNKMIYPCPVYKTSRRAGTLSTTGHSTNFVLTIYLKSKHHERHWVKRGTALLTQLDH
jgi:dynein heavy chain